MSNSPERDRYVSFEGLDCDANAVKIMTTLRRFIAEPGEAKQWADYFEMKLKEKERMGVDDLFFVGSQMNNIYAFFESFNDEEADALLYQVEQECC